MNSLKSRDSGCWFMQSNQMLPERFFFLCLVDPDRVAFYWAAVKNASLLQLFIILSVCLQQRVSRESSEARWEGLLKQAFRNGRSQRRLLINQRMWCLWLRWRTCLLTNGTVRLKVRFALLKQSCGYHCFANLLPGAKRYTTFLFICKIWFSNKKNKSFCC